MVHSYLMGTRFVHYWITCLLVSVCLAPAQGQSVTFRQLENQVYQYNNEAKYEQSQALLLSLLDNPALSPNEQFQATLLLSYTYKRLLDYTTAVTWLDKAYQLAGQTTRPAANQTQIQAQLALVYFDTHHYAKADRLMRQLARNRFRYLDRENRAKIVHQQGYLLFLAKRYAEAEATYDRALIDLRASSPCDMPMILVKKMQLYAATNQMPRVEATLREANRYADSCGIVKYRIYAYEELKTIYKARHNLVGVVETTLVLDSLNEAYAQAQHIADLHNQHQGLERQKQEGQLTSRQRWLTYALVGAGGLLLLTVGLLVALRLRRVQQRNMEAELVRMRTELTALMTLSSIPPTVPLTHAPASRPTGSPGRYPPRLQRPDLSVLSERQRDVLDGIVAGLGNRDIADKLCVSENTVKYHLKNIYVLLDVKDRVDLLVNLTQQISIKSEHTSSKNILKG